MAIQEAKRLAALALHEEKPQLALDIFQTGKQQQQQQKQTI